jgi:hypothetical protein
MADEANKPGGEPAAKAPTDEAEGDRPTVSPPFDPATYARKVLASAPTPAPGTVPATQGAPSGTKPPASVPSVDRGGAPASALSMLNARIPSNLPPIAVEPRHESVRLNAVDQEWANMELATRPPPPLPPDSLDAAPEVEIGPPVHLPLDLDEIGHDDQQAVETVRRPASDEAALEKAAPKTREREMDDRVSLGDYSGALEIAEQIVADDPGNAVAQACADNCRAVLRQMYATRIGPLDRVPLVMVPRDQLRWLSIDHKAGFVLSLVDGVSNLEMIIDVSGMPELDTLRILSELAQQRIISLR